MLFKLLALAEEYENKLRKQFEDSSLGHSVEEMIIHSLGLTLLPAGNKATAFLGKGSFSTAYRVIYNGHPAVAKISKSFGDIEKIKQLFDLKSKLGNLNKHILNVYDIKKIKFEDTIYYIAIIEELVPLNPFLTKSLFTSDPINKKKIFKNYFKDRVFCLNLAEKLSKFITEENKDLIKKLKNHLYLFFVNVTEYPENKINKQIFIKELKTVITYVLKKFNIKDGLIDFYLKRIEEDLYRSFQTIESNQNNFPSSYEKYETNIFQEAAPESKSLMELLNKLKSRGILWVDLYYSNLMERPSTREIVISDPGLFEY